MKEVSGGGDTAPVTTEVAPEPAAPAPDAGAQPAAPAEVTGGGDVQGGGGTCYQPAPDPVQCGQWVPAPVATGSNPPAGPPGDGGGGDAPPEPIAGPGGTLPADAPSTTPASQLPTWPEWQAHFQQLGLTPAEIAKISSANLTDAQLAQVYEDIHTGIVNAGGTPGVTAPGGIPGQSAWSPAWEQKFAALGLPAPFIAELKAQATQRGSTDQQLESVYQQLVQATQGGQPLPGQSAWSPAWEQKFAALGLPAPFIAELKAQAMKSGANEQQIQSVYQQLAQQLGGTTGPGGPGGQQQEGPGWNAQVEQAFRSLGMPDEVIKLYAESGAPLSGLEAAFKHASGRVDDFKQRGWWDKFTEAKVPPIQMWTLILGDQPAKDEDIKKVLEAHKKSQRGMLENGAQLATSLFPGGRLLQYAFGREFVSGDEIDRTSPMEIGMAALSGLAAFAAIKGARNLGAAWKLRDGNFQNLNNVNNTLRGLNLPATGTEAMEQVAMGATQTWGFKQKLLSLIPGTALHREVVGLGHAEAAARAFNNGGAAALMAKPDGALQVASLAQLFDDIKSGATRIQGGSIAYLGNLRKTAPMTLQVSKGQEIIRVAKSLGIGNGNSQLVGLSEIAGTKLGQTPEWLRSAANLVDDISALSKANRDSLGKAMAGSAAVTLGDFSRDGSRMLKYFNGLGKQGSSPWYTDLAAKTASQWPGAGGGGGAQIPKELLDVLAGHQIYGRIFDEGAEAIRTLDRANLPEGMGSLIDDASSSMDEARTALDAAKAVGKPEGAAAAVERFGQSIQRIYDQDPQLAARLFPTYVDESLFRTAQAEAIQSVTSSWAANAANAAAANADEVVEAAAPVVDDIVEAAAPAATTSTAAVTTAPTLPNAAADAVEATITRPTTSTGSAIGANWSPGATGEGKFTGTVSELLDRASRPGSAAATPAAPVATTAAPASTATVAASEPLRFTVNARGEAVTASGLVVPSYASPVSGLAPADGITADGIQRLQDVMSRVRGGA